MRTDLTDVLVIFDLDGTLIDTAPDLLRSVNHVLADLGIAALDPIGARPLVGRGVATLLQHGYAAAGRIFEPADQALVHRVIDHYRDNIAVESALFIGAGAAMDVLAAAGVIFAICTNKPTHLARKLLDEIGLGDRFAAIVGSELAQARKPDPRHLAATVAASGYTGSRMVMVGDSLDDVVAAQAFGVPSIAVSFGYLDRPAIELGASRVIHGFDELPDAVAEVLADRPSAAARAGGNG